VSTQINVTVGSDDLSEKARQQQIANRQAQLDKERTGIIEAQATDKRIAAQAAKGLSLDGLPLYNVPTGVPDLDRRPAASRNALELNLGHMWLFRDKFDRINSTGIREVPAAFGRSRTATDVRGQTQDVLLGSATGIEWLVFTGLGTDAAPLLPADSFSVSYVTPQPSLPQPADYERNYIGTRLSGRLVESSREDINFALPCGDGKFIFIYGFTSVWDTFESNAYYYARGLHDKDTGELKGYFDLATSSFTSSTIPDDLLGWISTVDAEGTIIPDGVVGLQGYRGTSRRINAYVCSNRAIREISIPDTLLEIIDIAYPQPVTATKTITYRTSTVFTYNIYEIPLGSRVTGDKGFTNNRYGSVFTPQVFETLNNIAPFMGDTAAKTFPESSKWGLTDNSAGAYVRFQDVDSSPAFPWWSSMYRQGLPFYHAIWPTKNEEPNFEVWDPTYAIDWVGKAKPKRVRKATLRLDSDREPREGAVDRTNSSYWAEDFITVWDWNDPSYCRQMCLSLGFSSADLTP
jgi:hypothetical protein